MIGDTDDWGSGVDELPPGVEELPWNFASIFAFPVHMTHVSDPH